MKTGWESGSYAEGQFQEAHVPWERSLRGSLGEGAWGLTYYIVKSCVYTHTHNTEGWGYLLYCKKCRLTPLTQTIIINVGVGVVEVLSAIVILLLGQVPPTLNFTKTVNTTPLWIKKPTFFLHYVVPNNNNNNNNNRIWSAGGGHLPSQLKWWLEERWGWYLLVKW